MQELKIMLVLIGLIFGQFACFSQFRLDELIGSNKQSVNYVYEDFKKGGDSVLCYIENDSFLTTITLRQLIGADSICGSNQDTLIFIITVFYDSVNYWNDCNMVLMRSNCQSCQKNFIHHFLESSKYRAWVQLDEFNYVTTKFTGSFTRKGKEKQVLYMEVSNNSEQFVLKRKQMSKSKWKKYVRGIKRLD